MTFQQIAYAERTTDIVLTPSNGLSALPIPFDSGQEILIPRLRRECILIGQAILVAQTPGIGTTTELAIAFAGAVEITIDTVKRAAHGSGQNGGSTVTPIYRIPPNTPGARYQLYAAVSTGSVQVLSPVHAAANIIAFI